MAPMNLYDVKLRNLLSMERRPHPQALLKDYLRDDLSSCSSSGFKSLPRRLPHSSSATTYTHSALARNRSSLSSSSSSAFSATLQRASEALMKAVRSISAAKKGILSRSFSKKIIIKRSFWRRREEVEEKVKKMVRWTTFRELLLEENRKRSDHNVVKNSSATTTSSTSSSGCSSKSNGSTSWCESEFTAEFSPCPSCKSTCSSGQNGATRDGKNDLPLEQEVNSSDNASACHIPQTNDKRSVWLLEEEKEQFSPVSVLNCPFTDDDNVSVSPLPTRFTCTQETIIFAPKTLCFTDLSPLIFLGSKNHIPLEDDDHHRQANQNHNLFNQQTQQEEFEIDKARELLECVTISLDNIKFDAQNLLLDFFKERISSNSTLRGGELRASDYEFEVIKGAEDWLGGQQQDVLHKECWELQDSRRACFKSMEEGGSWRDLGWQEKQEIGVEVESEVVDSLITELLLDLSSYFGHYI